MHRNIVDVHSDTILTQPPKQRNTIGTKTLKIQLDHIQMVGMQNVSTHRKGRDAGDMGKGIIVSISNFSTLL
jgi:hypothetical protein